jgi:hypothetical protein
VFRWRWEAWVLTQSVTLTLVTPARSRSCPRQWPKTQLMLGWFGSAAWR